MLNALGAEVVHPGEVLWRLYMQPTGTSQNELARQLGLPPRCINQIVNGQRAVTARTALLLARVYGGDGMDWLERQALWDLEQARRQLGQRRTRRSRHAPELARREVATREAAQRAAARECQAKIMKHLKDNQLGHFKPGYGRAAPPADNDAPPQGTRDPDEELPPCEP